MIFNETINVIEMIKYVEFSEVVSLTVVQWETQSSRYDVDDKTQNAIPEVSVVKTGTFLKREKEESVNSLFNYIYLQSYLLIT